MSKDFILDISDLIKLLLIKKQINMAQRKAVQIMFLGDGEVGKTSIITQYKEGTFSDDHLSTLGLDYITKKYVRDNVEYNIKVWDTAG